MPTSTKIAVDAMGGDFAPASVVEGAVRAVREDRLEVVLVGRRPAVERELERFGGSIDGLALVHAEEVVEMDDSAAAPLRQKRGASVRVCAELVASGEAAAMVSAGHTGATMAVAKAVIGTLPGVERPALVAVFPNPLGHTLVLDVGANVGTKASHLRQFAVMGHLYAEAVFGVADPRVGLLSIGTEEGKGTELTRSVHQVLSTLGLNFVGNVEGRDVFRGTVDVIVCDGFVGNVLLKTAESMAEMVRRILNEELGRTWRTRLGSALARPALDAVYSRTDPEEYGAAPLLGIRGGCFVGHGASSARGIQSSIRRAREFSAAGIVATLSERLEEMYGTESRLGAGEKVGLLERLGRRRRSKT